MAYNVTHTNNPLTENELYEGRMVCFANVDTNPNNTGILESIRRISGSDSYWKAVINGVEYIFDKKGRKVENAKSIGNPILYGLENVGDINPTTETSITRSGGGTGQSNTVSLNTMSPKDYFACEALNSIIQRINNPLAIDDGMISVIAAKAYKIAQAMAIEAYNSRENDAASSGGAGYVSVDNTDLQTNTEKILYNLNESLKAIKDQDAAQHTAGIKISTITPTVKIDNPSDDTLAIEGGGGGGIDAAALKAACENNLNWQTLPNGDIVSIVGFEMKDGYRVPAENSISKLMKLLEAQELITANNSVWYWLRKSSNNITITDITTFLNAYKTNIYDSLSSDITNLIDTRITTKVKAEALNS